MADSGVVQGVTFGVALLGAALGVINTVWSLWKDRVRLRVYAVVQRETLGVDSQSDVRIAYSEFSSVLEYTTDGMVGVRVTNNGFLDVTVTDAGFTSSNSLIRRMRSRLTKFAIKVDKGGRVTLPLLLKPRQSIIVWVGSMAKPGIRARLRVAKAVYVTTDCGLNFFGTGRLLRCLRRRAAEFR